MQEVWKDILGYEGLYQISDLGNVKRIARGPHTQAGRILKQSLRGRGQYKYWCVCLYKNGCKVVKQVHYMILESFVRPFNKDEVGRHLDGNRFDNRLCNLAHGTQQMNIADRDKHGNTVRGSKQWKARFNRADILKIRSLYESGKFNQPQLAKKFGVKASTIWCIINRKTWKHVK